MDPPRTTLCPGYTHVSVFSPSLSSPKSKHQHLHHDPALRVSDDEDEEYEEEIEYAVLDLGNIEPTLVPSSSSYRLIGLDTPTPFLQLSGTILRGRHENLLGSELIFTDDKDPVSAGQKKRGVTHVATTSKRITFKEVQLRPKDKPGRSSSTKADVPGATTSDDGDEDEDEGLEYHDGESSLNANMDVNMSMDIDDALEYVDLDPVITDDALSQGSQPRLSTTSNPPISVSSSAQLGSPQGSLSPNEPASPSPSPPSLSLTSFTSFISASDFIPLPQLSKTKEKEKVSDDKQVEHGEDDVVDPALRIDRLAGISPPLTRAPRGSKKLSGTPTASTSTASGIPEDAIELSKGKGKGKGKQKAKATHVGDQDTTP